MIQSDPQHQKKSIQHAADSLLLSTPADRQASSIGTSPELDSSLSGHAWGEVSECDSRSWAAGDGRSLRDVSECIEFVGSPSFRVIRVPGYHNLPVNGAVPVKGAMPVKGAVPVKGWPGVEDTAARQEISQASLQASLDLHLSRAKTVLVYLPGLSELLNAEMILASCSVVTELVISGPASVDRAWLVPTQSGVFGFEQRLSTADPARSIRVTRTQSLVSGLYGAAAVSEQPPYAANVVVLVSENLASPFLAQQIELARQLLDS